MNKKTGPSKQSAHHTEKGSLLCRSSQTTELERWDSMDPPLFFSYLPRTLPAGLVDPQQLQTISIGMGFRPEGREFRYIFVATKLPEPEHPELIPTSVHVPVMVLFVTVPCRVNVSPLGLPDLTVS
jgi:hypothetical protein